MCLRREIKEETGLDVVEIEGEKEAIIVKKKDYTVINYEPFSCSQNISGKYPIMVQVFICRTTGYLLDNTNESQELQWINLDELQLRLEENTDWIYPMHITTLRKYLKWKGKV